MVNDLQRWEMAWCELLHVLQTKVRYLMHTLEKPRRDCVPQLAQMVLEGRRASALTADSADMVAGVSGDRGVVDEQL